MAIRSTFFQHTRVNHFEYTAYAYQRSGIERRNGGILTDEREVIKRWKQHFEEHLNGPEAEYQGDGGNDVSSMVDGEDEPAPTMREVLECHQEVEEQQSSG
ncbi:conserved hypothetical protein [Culex quinquefasciatus]|uniref:Uncharacterized protein n=1 Tax=Culex quinquefasciatus TaxID=7176 RepID=B0X720_CULQU|nr:conserved hypothetical protein [Culex quinquefasciatus]|eukprot:XP_001865442.1 conserved hypothetical protein [Culex quinquefasciatus]